MGVEVSAAAEETAVAEPPVGSPVKSEEYSVDLEHAPASPDSPESPGDAAA